MKRMHAFLALLALVLVGFSATLRAEDTDIYVDNSTSTDTPNVLFVMYNGANMDAASGGSCTYADGTAPSTGASKTSGLLQCALVDAIASLKDGSVNIGIVVNNASSFDGQSQATTDKTKGGFHDLCNSSGNGGCIIRKLQKMDAAGKASLTAFVRGLKPPNGGQTDANGINLKVNTNSSDPTAAMQEAWAYYNGKVGLSGTNYSDSLLQNGCQRNFIVYIGNSQKGLPNGAGQGGITAAQVGLAANDPLLTPITGSIGFNPPACGLSTAALGGAGNWADEWTRLMFKRDGGSSTQSGSVQNIVTYTVNINADACTTETIALMASMAKNGGGKFFNTSSATDLSTALGQILNEVQAVNSVFSSASLPVSVNAQGTYLNQIFLGMFRPDADGNPRWMGNLKQYQLVPNSTGDLVLGDKNGSAAISSAQTGFISPNAVSYWTVKDTTKAPDDAATGGFFVNDLKGANPTAFDAPDGEVVEKGGVAQQLRLDNLKANFSGARSSTNPRRLYTFCPTGNNCDTATAKDLTTADNEFSTANSGIPGNAFGADTSVRISSIVRNGPTATVTTTTNHGFTNGTTITVKNVDQPEYNVTQTLTSMTVTNLPNTFQITGLPDKPTTPATGTYNISLPGGSPFTVTGISRVASTATASANDTVTVITNSDVNFVANTTYVQFDQTFGNLVPSSPPLVKTVAADKRSFTFTLPLMATSANGTIGYPNGIAGTPITSFSTSSTGNGANKVTTYTANVSSHAFHVGQIVNIVNSGGVNGTRTITATTPTSFKFQVSGNSAPTTTWSSNSAAQVDTSTAGVTILRKDDSANPQFQATMTTATDNRFANGDKLVITSGTAGFTTATAVTISCSGTCTTFTYSIPNLLPPKTGTVPAGALVNAQGASVVPTLITRDPAGLVTVKAPSNGFQTGNTVTVAAAATYPNEQEYLGPKSITCIENPGCTKFTYAVNVNPAVNATGVNMQVYSATTAPDRDTVIKWVRGHDNQGDEKGPGNGITVRESIHGDVLHSRPLVINYGKENGVDRIVAYYGANDGVFRAVNGNQSGSIANVQPGGEMWGLILPEHFAFLDRLRTNSPELKFPSTILASALPKNYFVDGPTGVYQRLAANGTISTAYIYLTMRRGGRLIYGLDVSQPDQPKVLWRIDNNTEGFEELGQTWSRPRLTLLQNYANPVLVFGGGYDPSQDSEGPTMSTMGRSIYIVDAVSGALVWRAQQSCGPAGTCRSAADMNYPVPSDVTFVDRDNNGKTDKLYFADLGGNLWRVDVNDASPSNWAAPAKLAALGCDDGAQPSPLCSNGKAPRKFFFPPSVLSIKSAGALDSYDAISIASGDREHPLKNTAAASAYNTVDRAFMVKDTSTALGTPPATTLKLSNLFNSTSTPWNGTGSGFYITLSLGEKAVNAALAVNGTIFFATNKPVDTSASCSANLGEARAYGMNPFDGTFVSNVLQGGGMPPSAVAGIVQMTKDNGNGGTTTYNEKFCIGCGISGSQLGGTNTNPCNSALENCNVGKVIPKNLRRTYWYKK